MQVQNNTKFRNSKDRDGEGGKFMRALPGADIQKADHRGKSCTKLSNQIVLIVLFSTG